MPVFKTGIWRENNWWIAQCLNPDIATQGGSESEALDNIIEALALHYQEPVANAGARAIGCRHSMTFRQVRFQLETAGFLGICQKPQHAKFIKQDTDGTIKTAILPHYTELSISVMASILCQAHLTWDEFEQLEINL